MSAILHISDLHLGKNDPVFDDVKSDIITPQERDTRQSSIRRSLKKLGQYLKQKNEKLDAVFVTGDISYCCDETGFQEFSSVLELLGDCLPPKSHIAVLPGNHDVIRGTPPSSRERYRLFSKYVVSQGYVTPLLDGIGIGGDRKIPVNLKPHYILNKLDKWVMIPINSSNYCQVSEPIAPIPEEAWEKFAEEMKVYGKDKVNDALDKLRFSDVARISRDQFESLEELLANIERKIIGFGEDPNTYLRIAILHHHLLPVSTQEEFKKFESLTNLGLLRSFLAAHKFGLVLHGHKHVPNSYWDYIPFSSQTGISTHRLLVVSGGTLGERYSGQDEVSRLINISPDHASRVLSLTSIRPLAPGLPYKRLPEERLVLWDETNDTHAGIKEISGTTVDDVYNRILSHFNVSDTIRYNLVCQITNAATAEDIPINYPDVEGIANPDKQEWFKKLVAWWQLDNPTLSKTLHFTHGDRIYRPADQISRVFKLLQEKATSSRAIVTLSRPETDRIDDRKHKFPSFCLAQFLIRKDPSESPKLDCVAFFRKQEMKYWWPVNVAELLHLLRLVFKQIKKKGDCENLELGRITTFASIARVGKQPPQVSVPIIDRSLDQNPDLLWAMSYAIFWPKMPGRKMYLAQWEKMIDEFVPASDFDPDGIPIPLEGLKSILIKIRQFASHHDGRHSVNLVNALEELYHENEQFIETLYSNEEVARQKHPGWHKKVSRLAQTIRKEIEALFRHPK